MAELGGREDLSEMTAKLKPKTETRTRTRGELCLERAKGPGAGTHLGRSKKREQV